jgi:hypothetical protein
MECVVSPCGLVTLVVFERLVAAARKRVVVRMQEAQLEERMVLLPRFVAVKATTAVRKTARSR